MFGIIPAYAGNTYVDRVIRLARRDHPRVCGEHKRLKVGVDFWKGSSPRMRGTRGDDTLARALGGIIPAYAGNTVFAVPLEG